MWENYLSHLERVSGSGHFLTKDRLLGVLATTKTVDDPDFTRRVYAALQRDLQVRSGAGLDADTFSELLQDCLSAAVAVSSGKPAMSPFTAHATLQYLAALLVKDLNHHLAHGLDLTATVVQKTLSIQRQWRMANKLVDALFFFVSTEAELPPSEFTDPAEAVATMLCLPLVTCPATELNSSLGRLANEISRKLEGVTSFAAKQSVLLSLPSHHLCAQVADLHLNNFVLHPDVSALLPLAQGQSEQLTLQKLAQVHLCRTPYHRDGTHDLHFFLFLVFHLLQSFCQTAAGAPVLTYLVPLTCSHSPHLPAKAAHVHLLPHFNIMIDRIAENEEQLQALTSPECWAIIQLIRTLLLQQSEAVSPPAL